MTYNEKQHAPTTDELIERFGFEEVKNMFEYPAFIKDVKERIKSVNINNYDWGTLSGYEEYDNLTKTIYAYFFIESGMATQNETCAKFKISPKTYRQIRDENINDLKEVTESKINEMNIKYRNQLAYDLLEAAINLNKAIYSYGIDSNEKRLVFIDTMVANNMGLSPENVKKFHDSLSIEERKKLGCTN
jgi:hypothetical protein